MSSLERDLNQYLFYEFGFDADRDESNVSESWPFRLNHVGQVGTDPVFEFEDEEPFFALVTGGLNFLPKAGMDVNALLLQMKGSQWIAARDPVGLEMSRPGDPSVPSGVERRQALQSLGRQVAAGSAVEILQGLFLRSEARYLGLFSASASDAIVGGLSRTIPVAFPQASAWRRLAWGVGRWLEDANKPRK